MDLIGYLRLLRRRWWIISLAILVSVGAAVAATSIQHKRYQTSTRLLVSGSSSLSAVDEITRRQLAQQRAVLFSQIATTSPVISAAVKAADATHLNPPAAASNAAIGASASGDDPFLTITVTADTPTAAQAIANQFVNVLPPELAKLDQLPSAVKALLTVVNSAGLPTTPISPRPKRDILIGLALGIVLGIAAALIRETLDTTLRDSEEVRRLTRATILGIVPREFDDERLPAATRPHSRRSEAYRQVRTNLEFAAEDEEPPRSFVVTSAGQGEGKSTTVANLALLISRAGKRVAVIDADLRKPTLASLFNATSDYGLSDVLSGTRSLQNAMQQIAGEQISVLASGPSVTRPSELLSSPAMEHILQELTANFDLVIVDSPPVLAITDALLVGKHTDGVVVVTRMRRTTRSGLRRSLEAIERVHARLFGVVVNAATESEDKRYGYTRGYTKGYLSQEVSPTEYLSAARSAEPAPTVVTAARVQKTAAAPPPYVPPAAPPPVAPPPPDPVAEPELVVEPEPVAEPETFREPEPVPAPELVAAPESVPEPEFVAEPEPVAEPVSLAPVQEWPAVEEAPIDDSPFDDVPYDQPTYVERHVAAEPAPRVAEEEPPPPAYKPVYRPEPEAEAAPLPPRYQHDADPSPPVYQPEPPPAPVQQQPVESPFPPYIPPPAQQAPPPAHQQVESPFPPYVPPAQQQQPPQGPPPVYWPDPEAAELEQPEPTYAPPAGGRSVGAVRPGRESRSRSGGKRRRTRAGEGDAEDQERQGRHAGGPVDVDHSVQEFSGNDAYRRGD